MANPKEDQLEAERYLSRMNSDFLLDEEEDEEELEEDDDF